MLVFKLSCKSATCYARGHTLEKRQIAENRLVEILNNINKSTFQNLELSTFYNNFISLIGEQHSMTVKQIICVAKMFVIISRTFVVCPLR